MSLASIDREDGGEAFLRKHYPEVWMERSLQVVHVGATELRPAAKTYGITPF